MNSLSELNSYVNSLTLDYTDERSPDVIFSAASPINQTQSVDQGFNFLSSVGIDIVEVLNSDLSAPYYTINVFAVPGAVVTWPSAPAGTTITNPSTGVYRISGIDHYSIWDAVKQATIDLPDNYAGTFTYTSTINYYNADDGNVSKSWTTAVVVNAVIFLTTPVEFRYAASSTQLITNTPQIINVDATYPGVTFTVTVTPNNTAAISTFTNSASGGTFSVNATTKVITISGTRAQVNARLAAISLVSTAEQRDFNLTYYVTNSLNGVTDSAVQTLSSYGLLYMSNPITAYYAEDSDGTLITNPPQITEPDYDGLGNYVLTITPSTTSAISTMSVAGTGGTVSFNNSTKVLTISGTRAQINDRLTQVTFVPATDFQNDFAFNYFLTTPRDETANKIHSILCSTNDTELSNLLITRNYLGTNSNLIFSSDTPQIIDLDTASSTYTVVFDCAFGDWSYETSHEPLVESLPTNPLSLTGTRSQINALLPYIRFYPDVGVSSNGTFNITLIKDGVTTVNQNIALNGTPAEYANARSFLITSSQTWTPNFEDARYGIWDVVLVGGGGSSGYSSASFGTRSIGGGGGGEVLQYQNVPITYQSYSLTVGAGGSIVTSPAPGSGSDGGSTVAFGYTALGGKKGTNILTRNNDFARNGGNSASGNLGGQGRFYFPDGTYTPGSGADIYQGGGGAGHGQTNTNGFTLGFVNTTSISGTRSSTAKQHSDQTFTNVSLLGGSGTGAQATVYIQGVTGTTDWNANCEITITAAGSGYQIGDTLRINVNALINSYATPSEDIILSNLTLGTERTNQRQGTQGVYISWQSAATSMHGWYGGGGEGNDYYNSSYTGHGNIGNLVSFAAAGYTQTNGISTSSYNNAPSGSGGGGNSNHQGSVGNGGSGVIGIRIR